MAPKRQLHVSDNSPRNLRRPTSKAEPKHKIDDTRSKSRSPDEGHGQDEDKDDGDRYYDDEWESDSDSDSDSDCRSFDDDETINPEPIYPDIDETIVINTRGVNDKLMRPNWVTMSLTDPIAQSHIAAENEIRAEARMATWKARQRRDEKRLAKWYQDHRGWSGDAEDSDKFWEKRRLPNSDELAVVKARVEQIHPDPVWRATRDSYKVGALEAAFVAAGHETEAEQTKSAKERLLAAAKELEEEYAQMEPQVREILNRRGWGLAAKATDYLVKYQWEKRYAWWPKVNDEGKVEDLTIEAQEDEEAVVQEEEQQQTMLRRLVGWSQYIPLL